MRLATKIAIGVLTPIVAYFGYDSIMGHWLVHRLCAKDGGLRISETAHAKGYLDESLNAYSVLYCRSCIEHLTKRQFEYVDVHVSGDPATAHRLAIRPGYYRLSLAPRGDARCDLWKRNVNLQRWDDALRRAGGASDHCVAVEALPGRPAGAVLTSSYLRYAKSRGRHIEVRDVAIRDLPTNRELARFKNYYFFVRWGDIFNWAPSQAAASCGIPSETYGRIMSLEPLMDMSKKTSSDSDMESLK